MLLLLGLLAVSSATSITDRVCAKGASSVFCRSLQKGPSQAIPRNTSVIRRARGDEEPEDPSCVTLKHEYETVCFSAPPSQAFQETKQFCDAFVDMCHRLLTTNLFTNIESLPIDYGRYCKKHKERFQYVCPDPLRFPSYAEFASEFCVRYKERCPGVETPTEPVLPKDPNEGHIYTREIKQLCDKMEGVAKALCMNPDILRTPKYQLYCYTYKVNCIDVYERVIYG